MQRLLPDPAPTTVERQLAGLDLVDLAYSDRPYVVMNFVTSLDGRAAIEGRLREVLPEVLDVFLPDAEAEQAGWARVRQARLQPRHAAQR